jgi:prophage tail gpP-like protein
MPSRPPDDVRIESVQGGDFSIVVDRATKYEIVNDLTQPSVARFELGDDGSWSALKDALAVGTRFVIYVNDTPRLTGRMLTKNLPINSQNGATIQAIVRTLLADAVFSSAEEFTLRRSSLKDAILGAYAPLGLKEKDFVFRANVARDLITGRSGNSSPPVDLEPLKEDDARVHPPESVYAFVERHLSRFHLTHWDAPDGRIVVGAPDDTQRPTYNFRIRWRGQGNANNVIEAEKIEDYEDVPGDLWVYGVGGGHSLMNSTVQFGQIQDTLSAVTPALFRRVSIIDESIRTQAQAEARARKEMSARSRMSDAWRLTVDGLTYWDGSQRIAYAPDTVGDVQIDPFGGASGGYLVYRTSLSGDAAGAQTSVLEACAKGVWKL